MFHAVRVLNCSALVANKGESITALENHLTVGGGGNPNVVSAHGSGCSPRMMNCHRVTFVVTYTQTASLSDIYKIIDEFKMKIQCRPTSQPIYLCNFLPNKIRIEFLFLLLSMLAIINV